YSLYTFSLLSISDIINSLERLRTFGSSLFANCSFIGQLMEVDCIVPFLTASRRILALLVDETNTSIATSRRSFERFFQLYTTKLQAAFGASRLYACKAACCSLTGSSEVTIFSSNK